MLANILRYILETSRAEPATLRALLVRQVEREEAGKMLTTAEKLRREGMAEGEARGVHKGKLVGKRESLLLLLRQRFGRLPAAAVARIGKLGEMGAGWPEDRWRRGGRRRRWMEAAGE